MNSPMAAILNSLSSTPKDPGLPQTIRENTLRVIESSNRDEDVFACTRLSIDLVPEDFVVVSGGLGFGLGKDSL